MEIKCTEAWNEGEKEGGRGGEGEAGEGRRKNVRFMELGKLKVIKSEDYSTAKLLKFLREVEGFRPVLNSKALGGQQYTLFTIYFYPFYSVHPFLYSSSLSSPSFHPARSQYRAPPKFIFRGASAPPIPPLSPTTAQVCRQRGKKGEREANESKRKKDIQRERKREGGRQRRSD